MPNTLTKQSSILLTVVIMVLSGHSYAMDWPQWRGPFLHGSTDANNLPSVWSETENIAWVSPLPGPSAATPVVCKDRVFVTSADTQNEKDLLAVCFDARNGKELWRKKLATATRTTLGYSCNQAAPSPVTDSKRVYFMYGSGDLVSLDYKGKVIWSRNIQQEYGNLAVKYGYSSSPVLYKGKLYIGVMRNDTAYGEPNSKPPLDSFLLAVDAKTGKNIWKQPRPTEANDLGRQSYSSPIVFEGKGRTEILLIGGGYVTGNDARTGKELWRFGYHAADGTDLHNNTVSLVAAQGLIYSLKRKIRWQMKSA